jgi:hypothetical protein
MLCDTCKNKHICKYYDFINSATIKLVVQINECELYSGNSQPICNPSYKATPMFREPLPSRPIDNEPEYDIEDEEKVYINIDNIDNTPQSATIIDLVLKGEKEDGKENR